MRNVFLCQEVEKELQSKRTEDDLFIEILQKTIIGI